MKVYDFELIEKRGGSKLNYLYKAKVTVEKGFWFWKHTEERVVAKGHFSAFWRYTDTGKLTEDYLVEEAQKVFEFENGRIEDFKL